MTRDEGDDRQTTLELNYPLPTPSQYVVMPGDNPSTMATKLYGDSSFDEVLATTNGPTADDLSSKGIGFPMRVPFISPQDQNRSDAYVPYQIFIRKLVGTVYPYLDTPEFKQHPNFWQTVAKIFIEVVAVAVANLIFPGGVQR